jgi:hypothetical protein
MEKATYHVITDPAELANTAIALVREQAPETRLLPIAARPVADHPEYQQVNRIGRDGVALKGGWTFLVNTTTRTVLRTVGDPDELDFETAMRRAMPIWARFTRTAPQSSTMPLSQGDSYVRPQRR